MDDIQTFKNVAYVSCELLIRSHHFAGRSPPIPLRWDCYIRSEIDTIEGDKEGRIETLIDLEDVFIENVSPVNLHERTFIIGNSVAYPPRYFQCKYYSNLHKLDCEVAK